MIFYLLLIFISFLLICGFNLIFASLKLKSVFFATLISIALAYLIDLIVSAIVMLLPKNFFNPKNKVFKVFSWERKFYEKIKIRAWKGLIPIGKGPLGLGLRKDILIDKNNINYLNRFLIESCRAETMHFYSVFLGFLILLLGKNYLSITIPVAFVNAFLQLLPFMVQRYLRPKLLIALKRAEKQINLNYPHA